MNWGKTKNILIVLFLLLNIFLFAIEGFTRQKSATIDSEYIKNAVLVAKTQNVEIDEKIVPKTRLKNGNMELFGISSEPDSAAERFLGKKHRLVSSDAENHTYQYESKVGKLTIDKNMLCFSTGREKTEIRNEDDAINKAFFELDNFDIKKSEITISDKGEKDGKKYFVINPRYKNINVTGAYLEVFYDGAGISELMGVWFDFVRFSQESEFLSDITTIITNMMAKDGVAVIDKIDFSYHVSDDLLFGKYISAIPVYNLCSKSGECIKIDARSGEQVY